jgi:hypothetical protein
LAPASKLDFFLFFLLFPIVFIDFSRYSFGRCSIPGIFLAVFGI